MVVVLATGCGGGGGSVSISAGVVARAAAATIEQESARIDMTIEAHGTALEAAGVAALDGSAMSLTVSIPGQGELEERLVDRVLYLRAPGSMGQVGTAWVSMSLDGLLPEQRSGAGAASGADPSSALDALRGANGDVETLGRDTLRAGSATHYRVRLDAQVALDRAEAQLTRPLSAEQIDSIRSMDGQPIDVWIDDAGRVLRERFAMALPQGRVKMSMEFYDFGVRVDVKAPPAADTTDFTDRVRGTTTV